MNPTTLHLAPKITAEVVLRFADGAETVVGEITYSPDMSVSVTATGTLDYSLKEFP